VVQDVVAERGVLTAPDDTTRAGRPARMPDGAYDPAPPVHRRDAGGLVVDFHGEDGRRQAFQLPQLPLPGWHGVLADALAIRLGPGGPRRTLASARSEWQVVRRFLRLERR
jgi:hypothetical protein